MIPGTALTERPVSLYLLLKLCFVFGVSLGIVASPVLVATYVRSGNLLDVILILVLAPLMNGLTVMIYGLAGYPAYLFFWRRKKFGLHKIIEQEK